MNNLSDLSNGPIAADLYGFTKEDLLNNKDIMEYMESIGEFSGKKKRKYLMTCLNIMMAIVFAHKWTPKLLTPFLLCTA